MAKDKAAQWAAAISARLGFECHGCCMFVDGTQLKMCRPSIWQQLCYNGHKRHHTTGWQGLMAPNGIIVQMFGPCLGTANDSKMVGLSRLIDILEGDFPKYYVYADQGYGLHEKLQHGISKVVLTKEEREYNRVWSRERICVEWGFGDVKKKFAKLDYPHGLKPLQFEIAIWYMAAVILRNCIVCMRGWDETTRHFLIRPPTLDEYLVPDGPKFEYWRQKYPLAEDVHMFAFYEAEQIAAKAMANEHAGGSDEGKQADSEEEEEAN